jgi:hypothetical protein
MRTRVVAVIALLSLPYALSAQILRPRPSTRTPAEPASLPPTSGEIARTLAYKRARWTFEAYSMFSSVQVPSAAGAAVLYTTLGSGTHADYRLSDRLAATVDLTASGVGGPQMQTAELGGRFRPFPVAAQITPFFDFRGGYARLADNYSIPLGTAGLGGAQQYADGQRYSGGFGAIAGAGVDAFIIGSWGFTAEMLAVQNRMTTYSMSDRGSVPSRAGYNMTSFRFAIGLKYNASRLHLDQNPTK